MSSTLRSAFKVKGKVDSLLLLEGINDCHVVTHICEKHKLPECFSIHNCDGHNEALDYLELKIKSDERPQFIGIVLDADQPEDNPSILSRLDAIRTILRKVCNTYQIPKEINSVGTIIPAIDIYPKVGIWLMPNNQRTGMLEDFLMELAKEKCEPSLNFAKECVDEAKKQGFSTFKDVQYAKAVIHTYLAWHQPEPGTTLGLSIKAGNLNSHAPLAISFVNWLKNLFEISDVEIEQDETAYLLSSPENKARLLAAIANVENNQLTDVDINKL